MSEPETILKIKDWRALVFDRELALYIVQAFTSVYLEKKYSFATGVSLK
jgi:hypothetical protein